MSLQVWLPLDGSLRNLGISNYNIGIARGTETYNDSGKIGKCFYANGTNVAKIVNIIPDFYNYQGYSLCAWFYIEAQNTAHTGSAVISAGNWNNQVLNLSVSNWSADHYTKLRISGTNWNLTYNYNFAINTWYHAVVGSDGNKTFAYINGVLLGDNAAGFLPTSISGNDIYIGGATYSTSMQFYGRINDVRIYNHALSMTEIREISQGLVLHYKLDGSLFGNPNLLARYVVPGQNSPTSTAAAGRTKWLGDYKIEIPATENADTYFRLFMTEQLVANTTYTISCKVSGLLSGSYYKFPLFSQGNSGMGVLNLDHNGLCSLTFTMTYTGTQTAATGANGETVYINFLDDSARAIATGQGPITVYDFKLEKGGDATPFVPSGSFHTIIQDSSGYNNNSILNEAISVDSNTVKYLYSTYFGDYNTPTATLNNTSLLSSLSNCTITWWGKYDTSKTLLLTGQSTSHYLVASDNNTYYHRNATVTTFYKDGVPGTYKCAADGWHFFAMTGVDISSWTALKINGYSSGWPLKGFISDFRIYATSLLDSDIKQLYNLGMKVDKKQNIHVFELQENNPNLFSALPWTTSYSTHSSTSNLFTNFNEYGEPQFTSGGSAGSNYIEIVPGVYEYDYTISVNAGNQFYIGFERYDANKTSRSNNACAYTWATKPSSDIVKTRYKGTINLTTDGTNPIKYIALRILNGWSGTTSGVTGKATIHNFSLRLKSTALEPSIYKQGRQLLGDEFKEDVKASFYKDYIVEANEFIER